AARLRRDSIDLAKVEAEAERARLAAEQSRHEHAEAVTAWEATKARHAVHALTDGLSSGDPCPVCERPLERLPGEPPADLEQRRQTMDTLARHLEAADEGHRRADLALVEARARHDAAATAVAEAEAALESAFQGDDLEAMVEARQAVDERLAAAKERLTAAREAEANIRQEVTTLREAEER